MSSILKTLTLAAMLATLPLSGIFAEEAPQSLPVTPQPPSSFTASQKEEIVHILKDAFDSRNLQRFGVGEDIINILRDALKNDPSILRNAVNAMVADDARIQQDAQKANIESMSGKLATSDDPYEGNQKGNVTIVEFFDVRCPYCRSMLSNIDQLVKGDGNVKVVLKDLPILGPASVLGSDALLAAHKQGRYIALRDAIMHGSPNVTMDSLQEMAQKLGLDWERLKTDMTSPDIQSRIDANLALAKQLNIQGTPAFVVGDKVIPGAVDIPTLVDAIKEARLKQN